MCAKQLMFLISLYYLLGCQKKKEIYQKKKTKLKHYQVYRRKERIRHIEIKQINIICIKIISIVPLIKLDNWMIHASSVNNLILHSATLPCQLEVVRSL